MEARDTGVGKGTKNVASVHVVRPKAGQRVGGLATVHHSDILFACKSRLLHQAFLLR